MMQYIDENLSQGEQQAIASAPISYSVRTKDWQEFDKLSRSEAMAIAYEIGGEVFAINRMTFEWALVAQIKGIYL